MSGDEGSNGGERNGSLNGCNGSSRRKTPLKVREEDEEEEEDYLNDVEEIKDEEEEEEEEDDEEEEEEEEEETMGEGSGDRIGRGPKGGGPNIVTIDDVKVLHKLAASNAGGSNRRSEPKPVVIDTDSIFGSKSGVTITPARPKVSLPTLPAGVTISTASASPSNSSRAGQHHHHHSHHHHHGGGGSSSSPSSSSLPPSSSSPHFPPSSTPKKQTEMKDPNLTDDTFVVEAPSFIVPYVYEKPPKESFKEFREDVKKLQGVKREEKRKRKEAKKEEEERIHRKRREEDPDYKAEDRTPEESSSEEEDDDDIVEVKDDKIPPSDNFFETALGKFFTDLGMNLVQESVQNDLLKQQIRKSHRDKSASVMHAIMSLKKNLEASKENNRPFRFELKKCKFCSYKTESELALATHLETPHIRQTFYRCNFCHYETKLPQEVLSHMLLEHGVKGKLDRAPSLHQCPQCPFEDNMKGKLTRHKTGCDKRFRPEKNQEPAFDWEPPSKIPKPPVSRGGGRPYTYGGPIPGSLITQTQNASGIRANVNKGLYSGMPQLQLGGAAAGINRGRAGYSAIPTGGRQMVGGQFMNNQVVLQALNQGGRTTSNNSSVLLPGNLANSGSVTIQSINQRGTRGPNSPSISITPLPGRGSSGNSIRPSPSVMKPGQPNAGQGKGNLVICEICDGFIKDLEQLRNHMQWIHKVKIHPKMIYNRPPLNCQKCQYRFFTDQGLERHLLGSHGLVTASMQDLANKGQDSGRCPVCGKVYQWKLLNHVAKDHQKTLKPAHLSYKCTVCTATFGQYKQFENHVYTAHSGAAKKGDKSKIQKAPINPSSSGVTKTPTLSDEITIIPQKKANVSSPVSNAVDLKNKSREIRNKPPAKANPPEDPDVIELDDEEEIDDVEDYCSNGNLASIDTRDGSDNIKKKSANISPTDSSSEMDIDDASEVRKRPAQIEATANDKKPKVQEGVEEIIDDEDEH